MRNPSVQREWGRNCTLVAVGIALTCGTCRKAPVDSPGAGGAAPATPSARPSARGSHATSAQTPAAPAWNGARILFLHHSTGEVVWNGGVQAALDTINAQTGARHNITERAYPAEPYPWDNYPYDYWNLWVAHAGPVPYQGQDTLEILSKAYDVIVLKHCYPVSQVEADSEPASMQSSNKTLGNYRLQYGALRDKLRSFSRNRFVVWTGAALVRGETDPAQADRARQFFQWVKTEWDQPGDNIFVWDFHQLETEGGLYLLPQYSAGPQDSHPNASFARTVAPLLARRLVDVAEGRGDAGSLTGR